MASSDRRRAGRLSRDQVVARALALLDEVGLEALTMRRLAAALGVQPGAIYWHFPSRQALEDAMAEAMLEGVLEPELRGSWQAQLAELARRLRARLQRRRDGASLALRAISPGPNGLASNERLLQILRDGGLSRRMTLSAAALVGNFVVGHVLDAQATEAAKARGLLPAVRSLAQELDHRRFPELGAVIDAGIEPLLTSRASDERFELGLQVISRGLAAVTRARRRRR